MSGHTMNVKLDRDTMVLRLVCHEAEGSMCRLICADGCESWAEDHEVEFGHKLMDNGMCNAVEWVEATGTIAEDYLGADEIPLHDGMSVEVQWQGDYWGWRAAR